MLSYFELYILGKSDLVLVAKELYVGVMQNQMSMCYFMCSSSNPMNVEFASFLFGVEKIDHHFYHEVSDTFSGLEFAINQIVQALCPVNRGGKIFLGTIIL